LKKLNNSLSAKQATQNVEAVLILKRPFCKGSKYFLSG